MKYYYHHDGLPSHLVFDTSKSEECRVDLFDHDYPVQISSIKLKKGTNVKPHVHTSSNLYDNIKVLPHEVWLVLSGKANVALYSFDKLLEIVVLSSGMILITFPDAGHSISVLSDDFKFVELKNTPYYPESMRSLSG